MMKIETGANIEIFEDTELKTVYFKIKNPKGKPFRLVMSSEVKESILDALLYLESITPEEYECNIINISDYLGLK